MADFVIRLIANIRKAQRASLQPVFIRGGGVVSRPAIALGMATACGLKATFTGTGTAQRFKSEPPPSS